MKAKRFSNKQLLYFFLQGLLAYVGIVFWHEGALRSWYERKVASLFNQAMEKLKSEPPEAVARWAVLQRNYLKQRIRDKGNPINKILAEERNVKKYGNSFGPTYEFLVAEILKKGIPEDKINQQIITSASTSNQALNQRMNQTAIIGLCLCLLYVVITTLKIFLSQQDKVTLLKEELLALATWLACGTFISQLISNVYYFFVE
ncbi:MAG: hypothetical protein RMJ44_07900 [Cytophagales bacterium]|nr:hypothetical protein [Bernardetiaceae bacterium]MDW8210998.1 hypothetical protein [Cytophagales bacterium]